MADDRIEIEIVLDDGSVRQGFGRLKKEGQSFGKDFGKSIVSGLAAVGAAFAGFAGVRKLIGDLREFEKAFAEINTITELTIEQQKELQQQLINTSAQFGTTAQAQAKAFYQIISAGVTDAADANELLVAANKLAIGGLTSTASSIDILTSAVNAFGKENLSATKASDILFGTVRLGKTTVDELSSSLGQILPSASALGVSFEDTNAALAALTTRGVSTSEAVTQLNAVFTAVLKQQDAAKKLGPEVAKAFNLQALQTKGLTGFLKDLNTALGGSEQRLVKLLGRAEGARAIITLAGDSFQTLENNVKQLENSTGAADAAFEKISQTLDQRINVSVAKANAIFLTFSQTTGGPLGAALDFVNKELDDILFSLRAFESGGDFFSATFKTIQISLLQFLTFLAEQAESVPRLLRLIIPGANVLIAQKDSFVEGVRQLEEEIVGLLAEETSPLQSAGKQAGEDYKSGLNEGLEGIQQVTKKAEFDIRTRLGNGISSAIQATVGALQRGENAFAAFGRAVLGIFGDLAIQLGQFFIIQGIAVEALKSISGAAAIAAGSALVALGTLLKGISGGSGSVSGGSPSTPGTVGAPNDTFGEIDEDEEVERSTAVTVNVEGTVLDPIGTGTQIAELLRDVTDSNDIAVNV